MFHFLWRLRAHRFMDLKNEEPRGKLRGINPNLDESFAASGGEFDPKGFKTEFAVY